MRVLVYTDEPVLAEGFRCALAGFDTQEIRICEEIEPLRRLAATRPDVILLAFHTSPHSDLLADLRRLAPASNIALSLERLSLDTAYRALESGVRGIFSKSLAPAQLIQALERVAAGEIYFQCPSAPSAFPHQKRPVLTARERELALLIAAGKKNKEIATAMAITEGSVKTYLSRLFRRLGTRNRFDLARFSRETLQGSDFLPQQHENPAQHS
jgi:DNA-binding NarL/FixJ family response regulator